MNIFPAVWKGAQDRPEENGTGKPRAENRGQSGKATESA